MLQGFSLYFMAQRALFRHKTRGLLPIVPLGFSLGSFAILAGFGRSTGSCQPAMTKGTALRFLAKGAGFSFGTVCFFPFMLASAGDRREHNCDQKQYDHNFSHNKTSFSLPVFYHFRLSLSILYIFIYTYAMYMFDLYNFFPILIFYKRKIFFYKPIFD